jgi:DNA primase
MFFSEYFLDEIRKRIPISKVIGKHITIKKRGSEYIALCPFHSEKTPSFHINDNKGFYHCFGCGAHGDIFTFLIEHTGIDFVNVAKNLALEAGLALPENSEKDKQKYQEVKSLIEINSIVCDFFQSNLYKNEDVIKYLYLRGIKEDTIRKFKIGFLPATKGILIDFLSKKNLPLNLAEKCGLIVSKESGGYYERFSSRIIFPIFDSKNLPIAFGGRIFPANTKDTAKYINSPETELFKKAENLYLLNFARNVAFKQQKIFIVEGYLDAIMLHQNNIENCVATMGTAINENSLVKLWQICPEIILSLDGDDAGFRAMNKTALTILPIIKSEFNIKFLILPTSKDPADIANEKGGEYFLKLAESALSLSDVLWQNLLSLKTNNSPEELAKLENQAQQFVNKIKDENLKNNIKTFFKQKFWELKGQLSGFQKSSKAKNKLKTSSNLNIKEIDEVKKLEFLVLWCVVKDIELINASNLNKIISIKFENEEIENFITDVNEQFKKNPINFVENFANTLENIGLTSYVNDNYKFFLSSNKNLMENFLENNLVSGNKHLYLEYLLEQLKLKGLEKHFESSLLLLKSNFNEDKTAMTENQFELYSELNRQIAESKRTIESITRQIFNL